MMQDNLSTSGGSGRARQHGVQAIARAGQVLRALQSAPGGIGLVDLANAVDLPKSTVHRLVGALSEEELLSTDGNGRITLGLGLTRLALAARDTLPQHLRPVLERLSGQLEETVDLAILDGGVVRFVDQLAAPHRLRAVSSVGAAFPLYCTANGKALLAAMPTEEAMAVLPARMRALTANTITSRPALLAELDEIRRRGFALDLEEHTEGICAVGAAVCDAKGPIAAISIPVPTPRFKGQQERYAQALLKAAGQASRLLGG